MRRFLGATLHRTNASWGGIRSFVHFMSFQSVHFERALIVWRQTTRMWRKTGEVGFCACQRPRIRNYVTDGTYAKWTFVIRTRLLIPPLENRRIVPLHKDEKHTICTNKNLARATTWLALNSAHEKGNSNVDKVLPCGTPQDTAHKPVAVNAKKKNDPQTYVSRKMRLNLAEVLSLVLQNISWIACMK